MRRSAASAERTRQVEKSTPAAYEPVPLRTSIGPSWAFCAWPRRTLSRLAAAGSDDSLHFSARRRGVSSRGLSRQPCSLSFPLPSTSGTMVKVDFMEGCVARMETVLHSSTRYFGRQPASCDDQEVRSAPSRLNALVVLHIPWHATSGEKERFFHIVVNVFRHPSVSDLVQFGELIFPKRTAAEELFRDSGCVQTSCSHLSRSAEFCSAFPQCLHVAPRVSTSWYRSLLLRARLREQFWISRVASEIAFQPLEPDSEIEFFISSTGNFIHFGPHEEVEEQSDRWGHRILWTTRSTFLAQMAWSA